MYDNYNNKLKTDMNIAKFFQDFGQFQAHSVAVTAAGLNDPPSFLFFLDPCCTIPGVMAHL